MQLSLFDEIPPGSPLKGNAKRIHDALLARPAGLTGDELEVLLELSHQTTSATLAGMKKAGWIKETGRDRKTRSGYPAAVVIAIAEPLIVTVKVQAPAKPRRRREPAPIVGDICSNRHGGNYYSQEAHRRLVPFKTAQQRRVYSAIKAKGASGGTADQVAGEIGTVIQSVTARVFGTQSNGLDHRNARKAVDEIRAPGVGFDREILNVTATIHLDNLILPALPCNAS